MRDSQGRNARQWTNVALVLHRCGGLRNWCATYEQSGIASGLTGQPKKLPKKKPNTMASVAPAEGAAPAKRPWKLCSETTQVKVIVVVMTVVMAAFEVGDRMLVVDFVVSFFTVVSLDLFERVGGGGAILGVLLAVACVGAVVWGSRKIEAMEAYAVKFDDASAKILGESLAIGPPSLKAPDLRQTSADIDELMSAAAATFPAFQSDVLQRLVADGSRYECNLKTRERVREKVKLE